MFAWLWTQVHLITERTQDVVQHFDIVSVMNSAAWREAPAGR